MSCTLLLAAGSANAGIRAVLDEQFDITCVVGSLDDLPDEVKRMPPDVLLVSRYLPGTDDLAEMLPSLRLSALQTRIVLLLGDVDAEALEILRTAACLGIYNVVAGDEPNKEDLLAGLTEERNWTHIAPLLFHELQGIQVKTEEVAPPVDDPEVSEQHSMEAGVGVTERQDRASTTKAQRQETPRSNTPLKTRVSSFLGGLRRPGAMVSIDMAKPFPRGILAVCGFQGGVGRTTVTAHVLTWLSEQQASPIIAVDAARPFPMLGQAVGSWRTTGFRDALQGTPMEWSATSTEMENVDLLASSYATLPDPPAPSEVADLLKRLATHYAWVVVDTPCDPDSGEVRGALMAATNVIWVVDGHPAGLDRIHALGRDLAPLAGHSVALNRAEGSDFTAADVEEFLQMPVVMISSEAKPEE